MGFPPLERHLVDHLAGLGVWLGSQEVYVGTRPLDDGWVAAVLRLDHFARKDEAVWLGERVQQDLVAHLCHSNQEDVPIEAVEVEVGRPSGAADFSLAVFVCLASMDEATRFVSFLRRYANPG